jgi:hypothetical protein
MSLPRGHDTRPPALGCALALLLVGTAGRAAEATVESRPGPPDGGTAASASRDAGAGWPLPDVPADVAWLSQEARTLEEAAEPLRQLRPGGERLKAVHDLVVLRLSYLPGAPAQAQDARTAFARRTGNCEGYARLVVELARLVGEQAVYVPGLALEPGGVTPVWHAWNAVRLDGRWALLDATFDDPRLTREGAPAGESYRTDYLFIPPEVAVLDHLPADPRWQLLPRPVSRRDFARPHPARASSVRQGLVALSPSPGPVPAGQPLEVRLANPRRRFVLVTLDQVSCGLGDEPEVRVACPAPTPGPRRVQVFTNAEETGWYLSVLSFEVVAVVPQ